MAPVQKVPVANQKPMPVGSKPAGQKKLPGPKRAPPTKRRRVNAANPIEAITASGLRRLFRRGDVARINSEMYGVVRSYITSELDRLVGLAKIYLTVRKAKTLSAEFVSGALQQLGHAVSPLELIPTTTRRGKRLATKSLVLQRAPFLRLVRSRVAVTGGASETIRIAARAFDIVQSFIESRCIRLCRRMGMLAKHAGRVTVQPEDFALAGQLEA